MSPSGERKRNRMRSRAILKGVERWFILLNIFTENYPYPCFIDRQPLITNLLRIFQHPLTLTFYLLLRSVAIAPSLKYIIYTLHLHIHPYAIIN